MPARHAAARQQLAGFLGVYDRFFRLPDACRLSPFPAPGAPLTWTTADDSIVIDVVRTAPRATRSSTSTPPRDCPNWPRGPRPTGSPSPASGCWRCRRRPPRCCRCWARDCSRSPELRSAAS
ncbi:hypothetical protein [Blastococcus brunescens]|uniref:Uncharacterized protein n=1 Tax=Blastococcus brunescens TaxID=1564165 RepID=A0ABZ1AY52_9ACTN|nr:hypothetical protein [Blastococcus sp. BMG 8361]WRL62416.1 hypothetical protein U6N30_20660 [Blastococcus sp. BMG 8361]